MFSIRGYAGTIRLCSMCGQPSARTAERNSGFVWEHFDEQWDGELCDYFPYAGEPTDLVIPVEVQAQIRAYFEGVDPLADDEGVEIPWSEWVALRS